MSIFLNDIAHASKDANQIYCLLHIEDKKGAKMKKAINQAIKKKENLEKLFSKLQSIANPQYIKAFF